MITENFTTSGQPPFLAAKSVKALDIKARVIWEQKRMPGGTDWQIIKKNVDLNSDYVTQAFTNLYVTQEEKNLFLTQDQKDAIDNANAPDAGNPFATLADVGVINDASETVKGVVEEATQAEMNAGTDTGGTLARLFAVPSKIIAWAATLYTPLTRSISTTAPLSGGGNLSADRTLTTSMNTNKLIGRGTAAAGVMEEITLGTNLTLAGTTLNAASGETLAQTLVLGNTTGGTDISVSAGDDITIADATASRVAQIGAGKQVTSLDTATYPSLTELSYVKGVTSAIQTQITAKKTIATGNAYKFETTDAGGSLQETTVTASRAVATDANGLPVASATTATELGYVSGVTSAIQTQFTGKQPNDGWISDANTWTYSSVDAPTGIISINADMTGTIGVGMRIKFTQTTVKYFIVTVVGAFAAGATLITLYGGTDYTLVNAAITLPFFSTSKYPFGFPSAPTKWEVLTPIVGATTQATPTAGTYYNVGSYSIAVPIGSWILEALVGCTQNGAQTDLYITLSTANNTGDANYQFRYSGSAAAAGSQDIPFWLSKPLVLTTKETRYFNLKAGIAPTSIIVNNIATSTFYIKARCVYL